VVEVEQAGVLGRDELKRRASAGVFIVATRGLAILLLGFVGNVVIAHLLDPHALGVVAIGLSLVLFSSLLADGGLGGALIRRAEPPEREELQALLALQLGVTAALTLVVAAIGAPFGEVGLVTALMVTSMPLVALQFPGRILLERSLSYRPLAVVEVSTVIAYYASAIGLVVAGLGVWGLAAATVLMRAVGAAMMFWVCPSSLLRPRYSWRRIRPLLGFGVRFQAVNATWLVRDQGLNVSIAAIGSVATLGLWTLAKRVMEIPALLFESFWRVSFPTMSQLLAAKETVAPLIERSIAMAATASGIVLTGLASAAPGLIPGVFGAKWGDASGAVTLSCLGVLIGGSISVGTVGYLYAVGDAAAVMRAGICQAAAWFVVALPLLPVLGVTAVGLGWLVSSVVEAVVFARATRNWTQVRLLRPLLPPVLVGLISTGAGWVIAHLGGADLRSGILAGLFSVVCYVTGLFVFRRKLFLETVSFAIRSVQSAASRPAAVNRQKLA
jgi:O-antigen/teichoic acid export membrane protein